MNDNAATGPGPSRLQRGEIVKEAVDAGFPTAPRQNPDSFELLAQGIMQPTPKRPR